MTLLCNICYKINQLKYRIRMDVFLIIISCIIAVLLLGINIYILALYCHPSDSGFGASLFCKILVVLGFTLAWGQILLVSADISASKGVFTTQGDAMMIVWYVIYCTILGMVAFLIPCAQFYYESDEDKPIMKRLLEVMCYEFILLGVLLTLLLVGFTYLGTARIPVHTITQTFDSQISATFPIVLSNYAFNQIESDTNVEIAVSFPVFLMGFLAFIGWFLLVLFGGVGLSALPIDLIQEYISRPKLMKSSEAMEKKMRLKKQAVELIQFGQQIQEEEKELALVNGFMAERKVKNQIKQKAKKFQAATESLENEHEIFRMELEYQKVNPVVWVFKLILGIIFIILSLLWILQILLYMLIKINGFPAYSFLNKMFIYLEGTVMSFIGTILLALFTLYLLGCTYKGNLKFGLRIPFLFTIYPMKVNETFMNSFLFNANLLLITSVAVTQFSIQAFSEYTQNSQIALMFLGQIQYLYFFTWFFDYNVFVIALLSWTGIVLIYLLVRKPPKPYALVEIEKRKTQDFELQKK
ncbi:unnamed protein product [Paramecium octaurelia]|uniref:Uncharacterized protein n=1 Tax=Paramecium octaurelia TaxID=43137 RepID=A0A8S1W0Y8_PAROT|nr:unnamed protein product [Paramecium octaurelia]